MGVTGCKKPTGHCADRVGNPGHEELLEGVVKPPIEKKGLADPVSLVNPGIKTRRGLEMLDRQTGFTRHQPEPTAKHPAARKARIKCEGTVDHAYGSSDLLAEIPQHDCGVGEHAGVATGSADSLFGQSDGFAAVRLPVLRPSGDL